MSPFKAAFLSPSRSSLQPAEHQARFISARIEKGEVDPNDRKSFDLLLTGALAAAPQIKALMLIKPDLHALAFGRDRERDQIALNDFDYSADPIVHASMAAIVPGASWGAPIWREEFKKTYLNLAYPGCGTACRWARSSPWCRSSNCRASSARWAPDMPEHALSSMGATR